MRTFASCAAALGSLLVPASVMAQEARPNIAGTHAALAVRGPAQAGTKWLDQPGGTPATAPTPMMSWNGDIAALGTMKSRSADLEWAGGAFHLTALRGRSGPIATAAQSFEYRRFAMVALGAVATQSLSARDALTLAATYAAERRRPRSSSAPIETFVPTSVPSPCIGPTTIVSI